MNLSLLALYALLACSRPPQRSDSADSADSAADSADSADSAADSVDSSDSARTYVHYMSTTAGAFTLAGQAEVACAGEAHLNSYADDHTLMGFCACTSEAGVVLGGFINGVVSDGQLTGTWAAESGSDAADIAVTGTIDDAALHATLSGSASWVQFAGAIEGAAL